MATALIIRHLGRQDYLPVWRSMQKLTDARNNDSDDEIWLLEHPPVFTLGQAGKSEHILDQGDIPVLHIDRGGQVTYHGPGQLVVYLLLDIRRLGLGVRQLVDRIEQAIIKLLADYGIEATSRRDAPGVYVGEHKIAALGLRVRRSGCYHGLSLNIDMDLEPFTRINPCGYPQLAVTQIRDEMKDWDKHGDMTAARIGSDLLTHLTADLGYTRIRIINDVHLPLMAVQERQE